MVWCRGACRRRPHIGDRIRSDSGTGARGTVVGPSATGSNQTCALAARQDQPLERRAQSEPASAQNGSSPYSRVALEGHRVEDPPVRISAPTLARAAMPTSPTRSFETGRFALSSPMDAISRGAAARAPTRRRRPSCR